MQTEEEEKEKLFLIKEQERRMPSHQYNESMHRKQSREIKPTFSRDMAMKKFFKMRTFFIKCQKRAQTVESMDEILWIMSVCTREHKKESQETAELRIRVPILQ